MHTQRNGVLASKYGLVIPKPIVEQQSAKQGCCLPEVSHLVREARHSPIKQLQTIVCRLLCVALTAENSGTEAKDTWRLESSGKDVWREGTDLGLG